MKELSNLLVGTEALEAKQKELGVEISGVCIWLTKNNDIHVNGTYKLDKKLGAKERLEIKCILMDGEGKVLHILHDLQLDYMLVSDEDTFSMFCMDINRFFNPECLKAIRILPVKYVKRG
ncbi:MAG: hypothetical protein MJ135_02895 [Oscillospiraceae bacterium]|nr:hypothetical protein [Oscillospiraceae bacterium]